ncbi:hypothetical protein [Litorivivens sp.]|uniref:hypothetical protein n=1 Tax=Litorivivens sp. TaxID=2020868 RepID=UPI00356373E8
MTIRCWHLPWATALLLLATLHTSFAITGWEGFISWCNPYWADCISISHSGRHGLAYFVFKGGMIPAAVLLWLFWYLNTHWLTTIGQRQAGLIAIASVASLALLVYTLVLGHSGDGFRTLRRFGVVLFFGLNFVNFVLLAKALFRSHQPQLGRVLTRASAVTLGVALISLLLDALLGDAYDRLENAFEWWLSLMLTGLLVYVGQLWQHTDFRLYSRR